MNKKAGEGPFKKLLEYDYVYSFVSNVSDLAYLYVNYSQINFVERPILMAPGLGIREIKF